MKEKKWTLLLLGENPEGIRQFNLSPRVLRWIAGGFGLFSLFVLALSGLLLFNGSAFIRATHLARENSLLTEELQQFRDQVDGFEETLAHLTEQDSRVRQLAGLDATDKEILEVGIGGPGLGTPEGRTLWPVDSALSKAAFRKHRTVSRPIGTFWKPRPPYFQRRGSSAADSPHPDSTPFIIVLCLMRV